MITNPSLHLLAFLLRLIDSENGLVCGSDNVCRTPSATATVITPTFTTTSSATTTSRSPSTITTRSITTTSISTTPVASTDSTGPNIGAIVGGVVGGVLGVSLLGAGTYYATKKARADVEKDRPIMVSGITAGEMASISKFPGPDGAAVAGLFTPPVAAAAVGGAALAAIPSNKAAPASASPTTFLAAPVMPTGLAPPNAYSDPYAGAAFSPRVESASFNSQDVPSNVVVVPEGAHVVPESERRKWTATRPFRAGMEDELDIEVGDICEVVMRHDDGWGLVNRVAPMPGEGMVPLSILEPFDNPS